MIEKPESPHNLIGDHWPEIDEMAIAGVAAKFAKSSGSAITAQTKSQDDAGRISGILPEGFGTQIDAIVVVGGMATDLSTWAAQAAEQSALGAESVALSKLSIYLTTVVAEALIAAKELEMWSLAIQPGLSDYKAAKIQQLQGEIKQLIDDAKQANKELYDGIYTPTAPAAPGLHPLVNNAPFGQKFSYGDVVPAGNGHGDVPATPLGNGPGETQGGKPASTQEGAQGTKSGPGSSDETNQGLKADSSSTQTQGEKAGSSPTASNSELSNATQGAKPGSSPTLDVQPASATSSAPSVSAPSASSGPSASGLSSVGSSMPKMPSAPSAPSGGGLGGGSGLSGLGSGGGASASPASLNPTQQFLNGAAQGFSQSPVATGASAATAAAQPFRPPAGSTMQTSPAPVAPTAPAAATPSAPAAPQQVVTSSPSAPVGAGTPPMGAGAGGVPLAPPPAAGVPNAAPPPAPAAPPPAAAAPPGGGGGPVSGPPPGIMNLGGKNAALKAVQMGAHTVGEGLRSTPEFSAAMALVAALNAPRPVVVLGGWSCAVFGAGASTRFVVAERHGLSWTPAGVFLPAGVKVAHLDERVPADVRYSWRGLDPSVLVLAEYAKAIGEQPRIVVARAYHPGMPGWFGRGVVLGADESSHVIINNPLDVMGGPNGCRHRLEIADPESWKFVMSLKTDEEVEKEVRAVAEWLVESHNRIFEQWPEADADAKLRAAALAQIGREGGIDEIKALLAAKMTDLATRLIGTPNYGTPQWRVHTGKEMALRGWEALLLGLGKPTHMVLADMQYAVLMATQPILPMPAEAAAAGA